MKRELSFDEAEALGLDGTLRSNGGRKYYVTDELEPEVQSGDVVIEVGGYVPMIVMRDEDRGDGDLISNTGWTGCDWPRYSTTGDWHPATPVEEIWRRVK